MFLGLFRACGGFWFVCSFVRSKTIRNLYKRKDKATKQSKTSMDVNRSIAALILLCFAFVVVMNVTAPPHASAFCGSVGC